MTRYNIALFACLLPGAALACGPAEKPVLTCRAYTNQQIEVCQGPTALTYRYGAPGKLKLVVSQKNNGVIWEHGEGVSTGIMDTLMFTNAGTEYLITHVADFNDPTSTEGRIAITPSGKETDYAECASAIRFTPKSIKLRAREPKG